MLLNLRLEQLFNTASEKKTTKTQVLELVVDIIRNLLDDPTRPMNSNTKLSSLGFDNLAYLEVIDDLKYRLPKTFSTKQKVELNETEIKAATTVGDIVDSVYKSLQTVLK